ncbi:MAG: DUF6033 family protein [Lachnospiraceae bacterium]|nr:DUF6033 family protein [Lachnospiraceae bacterium]
MAGLYGISAYQQMEQFSGSLKASKMPKAGEKAESKVDLAKTTKGNPSPEVETKAWTPSNVNQSLIPQKTEYGFTIGEVKLTEKAQKYYDSLKAKYHNMEFIAVSNDMKAKVQQNIAAYGNATKMVVLIDEEKLERMAEDESYRKKYEGIIAMAQGKLEEAKNSLTSSGASVRSFGMSVDSDGKESYFATVDKSQELQKKRIEKNAADKKAKKAQEKKKAAKEAQKERLEKAKEQRKAEKKERLEGSKQQKTVRRTEEYEQIEAPTLEELLSKVSTYSYNSASDRVVTDEERVRGTQIDFRW